MRILAALRQRAAAAVETATEDQASNHAAQSNDRTPDFDLEVTEQPPTTDQLQTILNYVGSQRISSVIKGATTEQEALRKFRENIDNFQRPVVCPLFPVFVLGCFCFLLPHQYTTRLTLCHAGCRLE
jgi:hypothetical protein